MIQEIAISNDLADNEIDCGNFVYTVQNPIDIEQLRFIERKREEHKEYPEIKNEKEEKIKESLKVISSKRRGNRRKEIESISETFIELLKSKNIEEFRRNSLRKYFEMPKDESDLRTMQRVTKEIIKYLEINGIVKQDKNTEKSLMFRNRILYSKDYGSYQMLMKKNGYKYDEEKGAFLNSFIPYDRQGCYSMGSKSIIRAGFVYEVKVYKIL